jgi:hypothetical protein
MCRLLAAKFVLGKTCNSPQVARKQTDLAARVHGAPHVTRLQKECFGLDAKYSAPSHCQSGLVPGVTSAKSVVHDPERDPLWRGMADWFLLGRPW